MKEIVNNVAKLIKVKTLVTIIVMALFAVEVIRGNVTPDMLHYIVVMVIAFYFGTQSEKGEKTLK
ncbi:MAG: hypothetical protein E7532_08340 [Ruminococcaceae bacterium]|nr:hypothetical protein [Oscillospiraceae bacterium]